ncbi:hypothetical protein OG548_45900 [Streptomyces sp. NBC_01356]|uniref:hypothetical protein n=1 Tax=Streptomyces sp. NBC_01356 TaxID=2903836 RepID=UPI002E2EB966|nr:hypothetical protein [Streptomyces sp. NBC_01356]
MAARKLGWLLRFLTSAHGLLTIVASAAAGLAVGVLPNLAQAVPGVGDRWWWLALVAIGALVVFAVCATLLHGKEGVGIVLLVGESGWDTTRLSAMRKNALQRHASCFTVNVSELLGQYGPGIQNQPDTAPDRVGFAQRVMQARMLEEGQTPEQVSLYVTARHADAYRLGGLLRDQRHTSLSLMMFSREQGVGIVEALRLHSGLTGAPDTADLELLRGVLARDPESEGPEWVVFAPPGGAVAGRVAVVLPMAGHNAGMREEALAAARDGRSETYRFPSRLDGTGSDRCVGALVFATRPGNVPDRREVYEALIRYVNYHWQQKLSEVRASGDASLRGWLFTDGPVEVVLAMGSVLGRQTDLVPWGPPHTADGPGARMGGDR